MKVWPASVGQYQEKYDIVIKNTSVYLNIGIVIFLFPVT